MWHPTLSISLYFLLFHGPIKAHQIPLQLPLLLCHAYLSFSSFFFFFCPFFFFSPHATHYHCSFNHHRRPYRCTRMPGRKPSYWWLDHQSFSWRRRHVGSHGALKTTPLAIISHVFQRHSISFHSDSGAIQTGSLRSTRRCPPYRMNRHYWEVGHHSHCAFHGIFWLTGVNSWGETPKNLTYTPKAFIWDIYWLCLVKFQKAFFTRLNCQLKFV